MRRNKQSEKHIRRIDISNRASGSTRGFQVHFSRDGRLWTKFFSDSKHGSKEKALKAARKFRNALLEKLPDTQTALPMRESANGYSIRTRKNRDGTVTQYVSASAAIEAGKSVRKAFRVSGDMASAVQAALDWRLYMARRRIRRAKRAS
jgi:hypothetical protein